jgi:hypothetical protein
MRHLTQFTLSVLTGLSISILSVSTSNAETGKITYPAGYQGWFHVKSMVIEPGHPLENPFQGIHHIYVNEQAKKGLETGNYKDGSVFVFDLLGYQQVDKSIQEANRKLVGVMEMDQQKYPKTGGWGFEGFAGNSKTKRLVTDGGQNCFACHLSQKKNGFVFTKLR